MVGWTQAAQRLVGYSAADVVGRSGAVLLAAAEDWEKAPAVAAESSAQGHWSGFVDIRHRDGHTVDVRLCVSLLTGRDGRARWVISATDKVMFSSWGAGEAAVHTLPSTLRLPSPTPIGVVIRDTHLRCTWVSDTQGAKDGIPVRQRLGRTLTETAPGPQADMLEALMHQVLESGVPAIHTEHGTFLQAFGRGKRTLVASLFRLDDAQGRTWASAP
ncbi:PAS domain-containing protein [Streptomyces sp. NPDC051896]|uniref:PAS domain-containing protein n=1 Tax=Streptomyces sp. NPDC051896 TaxID=3155416 RepID=UPI003420C4B3